MQDQAAVVHTGFKYYRLRSFGLRNAKARHLTIGLHDNSLLNLDCFVMLLVLLPYCQLSLHIYLNCIVGPKRDPPQRSVTMIVGEGTRHRS